MEKKGIKTENNKPFLLHLSNISFDPADVVSVYWEMNTQLSKKVVTRIRTRYEVFILDSDSPSYVDDIEKLTLALERHK